MRGVAFLATFAWLSSPALSARAADEAGPRNALSLHPLSLAASGLAVQYERHLMPRRWSMAFGMGFRSSSDADYSSWVTSVGIEPRYWLWAPKWSKQLGRDAMTGPFVSPRVDASFLMMTSESRGQWLGGNPGLSLVGSFGWRFTLGHFETTPSFGVGSRTDFDAAGRLAPWTRAVYRFGWTVGWLF